MGTLIRIFDDLPPDVPGPAIELVQLLDLLPPQARSFTWSILELEGRAKGVFRDGRTMLELERAANESTAGLILTWEQLREYAQGLKEVISGTFVAYAAGTAIPPFQPGMDIYGPSELVIEAVDTNYWQLYARDEQLLRPIQDTFRRVEVLALPAA
jgi:hypothetical protein